MGAVCNGIKGHRGRRVWQLRGSNDVAKRKTHPLEGFKNPVRNGTSIEHRSLKVRGDLGQSIGSYVLEKGEEEADYKGKMIKCVLEDLGYHKIMDSFSYS